MVVSSAIWMPELVASVFPAVPVIVSVPAPVVLMAIALFN